MSFFEGCKLTSENLFPGAVGAGGFKRSRSRHGGLTRWWGPVICGSRPLRLEIGRQYCEIVRVKNGD
jgi:hypothetical protein